MLVINTVKDFFNSNAINFLKIRASFGTVGNDNASSQFGTITTFPKYTFGGNIITGSALDGIPNLNVSWENQIQANFGYELNLETLQSNYFSLAELKSIEDIVKPDEELTV